VVTHSATVGRRLIPPKLPLAAGAAIASVASAALLATFALRSTSTFLHVAAPALLLAVAAWTFLSEHYERTLAVLALYLGLLDGYLKLKTGSTLATLGRDVLLYAIASGALIRLILRHRPIRVSPLALGVAAWVVICLVQVLNPVVPSISHALAGVRQHIEFVPLFFFGYAVMRSESRLTGLFWLLIFVAAVNGIVSLVQSELTPAQLASWGPGYANDILGLSGGAPRTFQTASGVSYVRPPALGSDFGFGGVVAAMALPGALAIVVAGGKSRRYIPALAVGLVLAAVGLATSQSRTAVVAAAVAVIAFLLLTANSRRGLVAIAVTTILGLITYFGVTTLFGGVTNSPNRYSSIVPSKVVSTTVAYREGTIALVPTYIVDYPLGDGVGSNGPAGGSSVGGSDKSGLDAESEPTFLILELGLPGLVVMYTLMFLGIKMGVGLRRVGDRRLQIVLAALSAVFIALCAIGYVGIDTANSPEAPFIWLTLGTLAYWYGEMRRGALARRSNRVRATLMGR
jgi:hypothetical protein